MREYAKNGNLDKLMAILETKIANLDARDTAVSEHAKLKASYLNTRAHGRDGARLVKADCWVAVL